MLRAKFTANRECLQALLREIRIQVGLTQTELAARLEKPQSFVSKYESGERRLDLAELDEICRALGIALPELVRRYEERTQ